jgi:transcriptional regulator with XRE-family HTH domain
MSALVDIDPSKQLLELGERVRSARRAAHLTQVDLCGRAGIARDTLSRLERGETVDTSTLARVLSAMGMRINVEKTQLRAADMRRKYAHVHDDAE